MRFTRDVRQRAVGFNRGRIMKFAKWAIYFTMIFVASSFANSVPRIGDVRPATVEAIQAGPTPFISFVFLNISQLPVIKSLQFTITPKPGSVTRPVSAIYSNTYLQRRGFISAQQIMLPVFGLYANYSNTVSLTYSFSNGTSQQQIITVPTAPFSDPCGFNNRTVIQARTNAKDLSYDYILVKNQCGTFSPTILDTDGEVRWVGTAGIVDFDSTLFQNAVYLGNGASLRRIDFDGTVSLLATYSGVNLHHNIDYGKQGIILEEDLPSKLESTDVEVDAQGNILKTWDLAMIISNAMIAGGDDPTQFVHPAPSDWFHNNATAYRKSDNTLIVSSRENFVIAIDYDSGAIKWILGDPTKQWFQFPSLRQYALTLGPNTLPPVGQHAVSFTDDDKLLLFDDGRNSITQNPPGANRTYSAPRKYDLNLTTRVATEIWNYPNGLSLYSPFCSSVYEDWPLNYLVDYAIISNLGPTQFMELLGLAASGAKVFDYRYPTNTCDHAWNSIPVHLERMQFTSIVPLSAVSRKTHGSAGTFDLPLSLSGTPSIECRSAGASSQHQVVVTFTAPQTIVSVTVTPQAGKTASISGFPVISGNQIAVNLNNVSNAQTISVNIGLRDGTATEIVSVPMTVLAGDSNLTSSVNSSDVAKTKSLVGQSVTATNYRQDVAVNGVINSSDVALVKSLVGTAVPIP